MSRPWRRITRWLRKRIVGDGQHRRVPLEEQPPGGEAYPTPPGPACEGTLIDRDFDRARPYTDRPRGDRRSPSQDVVSRSVRDYYWQAQRDADRFARNLS